MFDPTVIIKTAGLMGVFFTIFAESGLLIGFFLPGDTLLFASGIFASQGLFSIQILILGCIVSAIVGDSVGYWMGKSAGRKIFIRKDSSFMSFSQKHVDKAEHFYKKYGPMTIILARFIPVVRTFAPIIAGIAHMNYRKFLIYNIVGGIFWATSLPLLGYYLGALIPNPDRFLMPVIMLVLIISFLPFILKLAHHYLSKLRK